MSAKPAWVEAVKLYQNSPSGSGASQGVPDPLPAAKPRQHALWLIGALSLAAALLMGVVAVFSWQSLRELQKLDSRFSVLKDVERRLGEKVDRGNGGLLKQFDRTNSAVQALHQELGQLRGPVDAAVGALRDAELRMQDAATAVFQAPAVAYPELPVLPVAFGPAAASAVPADVPADVPVPTKRASAEATGTRFERRESPDGSVSYRRVN